MTELRKLQLIETSIVADIDAICEKYKLRYYIIGGTLLGAVRHKGFIPWDDDIDLVMYREDYNRLIEIVQAEYSEKYFVQTFETDPYYTRYIAKIRLKGTTMLEECQQKSKAHAEIYIDIFPLDHVKKSDGLELKLRGVLLRWLFAYKTVRNHAQSSKSGFKLAVGKIFRWCTFIIPNSFVNRLFNFVCEKDNGYRDCPYTTNFASHFKWKTQMFPNEVYGEGVRLEFEGHMFAAPKEYELIFERLYGKNYMELPPENKRAAHSIVKLDLGKYGNHHAE